jgi:hypothetical protein
MTIRPSWITPAGSLGSFEQGSPLAITFTASNTNIIELISGSFPSGLRLDEENKILEGVPVDIGIAKTYDFVLRASNNTGPNNSKVVQDRSFTLTITSDSKPILLDLEGTLDVGLLNESYVLNNSTVNFQFTASANSIPAGQKLKFYVEEGFGDLPPGLKLSEDGLLFGTLSDSLDVDFRAVQGSYDGDFYDVNPYDYGDFLEPARATSTIGLGKVTAAEVIFGGFGYLEEPNIVVGGSVNVATVINGGVGYIAAPEVVFSNSPTLGGITAKGFAVMVEDPTFVEPEIVLEISGGGSGEPTSTIDGGNAEQIDPFLLDGGQSSIDTVGVTYYKVSAIVITDPGTGYTIPPTITFKNQGSGFGASAVCNLKTGSGAVLIANTTNSFVNSVSIVNPGSGYSEPPLLSFTSPTAGSRIITKVYKFKITVSNGVNTDSKVYSIMVKSEDSLRVDSTFILTDTGDIDTSRTFIQPPIWITASTLPSIRGDNNYTYDLEVFDTTPNIGEILFSLMDTNFDGSESQLGPANVVVNQTSYDILNISSSRPAVITLSVGDVFKTGDRVKLDSIQEPAELDGGIYFVKKINSFSYELYSDRILINRINTANSNPYALGGKVHPNFTYLNIDPIGGEIFGFIPYQPEISRTYTFTVKASRILEDLEVATTFKQFQLTVKGNIDSDIQFITPSNVGVISPNELSLLKIEAVSTLASAAVNYQVIPGFGRSGSSFTELNLSEKDGNIFIEDFGINPFISLDKGQVYKINIDVQNFSVSLKTFDGTYFSRGLRHSDGSTGVTAQEKSNGYFIFNVPFDSTEKIKLEYKNISNDGLFFCLNRYDSFSRRWLGVTVRAYFTEYDALVNNQDKLNTNEDIIAAFLDYRRTEIQIKRYNKQTLIWELQNYNTIKPDAPINNQYWLDIGRCNFGILEFRFVGIRGVWVPISMSVVTEFPSNSIGSNGDYFVVNDQGIFSIIRKINGVWRVLERPAPGQQRGAFDPNVFFRSYTEQAPITNLTGDVWFKYRSIYDGKGKEIVVFLKSLDSLPTDIKLSTNGDIIGKISPTTGNIFRSFYTENTLYLIGDVVTFDNDFYVCTAQYRSSGNWFQDLDNWELFFYNRRSFTSFDVTTFGIGRFSIAGPKGNDETSIDKLLRFRVRAKDTQNVFFRDKDFTIEYNSTTSTTLTNVYLKPFLKKEVRDIFFNFITNPNIFNDQDIYRLDDQQFGVQRNPKMLLLGGIESTLAERYAGAVQRNYYDRPLYFGEIKKAVAIRNNQIEYEVVYVEINDPYEINGVSVRDRIKLDFEYDPLTADYTKIRMDGTDIDVTRTGLDLVFPSSITLMQEELKKVTLQKLDSVLIPPEYEDWGRIPELQLSGPNEGQYIDLFPVTEFEDWGNITERTSIIDDFLLTTAQLFTDDSFRPLWMNTSQDRTGNPIGYVKAVPICYVKPGKSDVILEKIRRSGFDFKNLNFTIDRLIIENAEGETGDKYIKFINRDII